jgi:glycosyltransferase involved in cell wall biosynthesis
MVPALTLAFCCYNFERFVAEAVEGAFAQAFRPLEVVISDDHSPDATWAKIVETVMRLGGFPSSPDHQWQRPDFCGTVRLEAQDGLSLVLNRNENNLGLALHENKLFELSSGEWIAFQAGDDVSKPNRMTLVAELVAKDPGIRCIECGAQAVKADGSPYPIPEKFLRNQARGKKLQQRLPSILGAGAVYHRDVYFKFGPLAPFVANEDHVLPLRAALLGQIVSSPVVTVLYRKHGENVSGVYAPTPESLARYRLKMLYAYYQSLADLHRAAMEHYTDWRIIKRYRRRVEDDLFRFEFLGRWQLEPSLRPSLLLQLFCSPRLVFLFLGKALDRILG